MRKILIPIMFDKKMTVLFESFFKNGNTYTSFISYMFMFSVTMFWELYEKYNVKSLMSFMKFHTFIKENLKMLLWMMRKKPVLVDVKELSKIEGFKNVGKVIEQVNSEKGHKIRVIKDIGKYYDKSN